MLLYSFSTAVEVFNLARVIYAQHFCFAAVYDALQLWVISSDILQVHSSNSCALCHHCIVRKQVLRAVEWLSELCAFLEYLVSSLLMDFIAY